MIHIIAAISKNNALGKDNQLLWHLPNDLKYFKQVTTWHPVIMGRKTFDSIGKPLPKRLNLVISRNKKTDTENLIYCNSLDEAIQIAHAKDEDIFIIGGGEIYRQAMPLAQKLHLTIVDTVTEADTFFPEINLKEWQLETQQDYAKDEKHVFDYSIFTYLKKPIFK
jgi:dihydrofolate reductase